MNLMTLFYGCDGSQNGYWENLYLGRLLFLRDGLCLPCFTANN